MQVRECLFVSKSLLRSVGSTVIAMCLMSGCSSITIGDPSSFTAITAPAGSLRVTETAQLAVHTQFDGSKLAFYVNGVAGGDSEIGTISSTGLYTAPAIVPIPNSVIITSASVAHPDYPKGSVTLAVWNPIPVIDSLTPSGFPEGDTQVAVTGSKFVYGARVMWNGKPVETTYVSSTHLEAIIPAANPGTYPLLVSNPDPGSANSKTLQVQVAPGQVKLKLQAYNGSDVRVRNTLNLGLEVTGTINKAVTLTVNGIAGGNSTIGTASSSADGSIAY